MAINWLGGTTMRVSGQSPRRVTISQGQYEVNDDPDAVITTILGSCVAACIRDTHRGFGGMNHFVLPRPPPKSNNPGDPARYGDRLMELLVDALLRRGANRNSLEAKIFGGANPLRTYSTVGQQNSAFAKRFLEGQGIAVVEVNVGGPFGCKLDYWPVTGKTKHTLLNGV